MKLMQDEELPPEVRRKKLRELTRKYKANLARLDDELAFLRETNIGGEFMSADKKERVNRIARRRWRMDGEWRPLLDDEEVHNLHIERGTLTHKERKIINNHIVQTIKMLNQLPYPKHLRNVPEYAGGHHEKLDGTGYPQGLTKNEMSIQARIMAIADIFEALTARDRPYKKGKTLSQAMRILGFMKNDAHIDPDLFEVFVREKIYLKYARENLDKSQIDEVVI
jgi:hypothetical protein